MMTKFSALLFGLCLSGLSMAQPYTGGIPLSSTAEASKHSLALTKGDPRPVVALAMRHGQAKGHFAGQAAAYIKQKAGVAVPVFVEATRKGAVHNQPGCTEVEIRFFTSATYAATYPEQKTTMAVCPNR